MDLRRTISHLLGRSGVDVNHAVNEESFWDHYAKNWKKTETSNEAGYLGAEWKFEAEFISLLEKYASSEKEALEIGCGGGKVTVTGVKLFKHVYAADLSEEMLRKSKQAVPGTAVSFHKLDGFTLTEFADSTVDFVYAHDVFVQLSSLQAYPYLMEIGRVLKKGGLGLVSCYDFVDRFDLFKQTSLKLWNQRKFPIYRRLHFVTEDMLRTMLSDLGLEVLEVQKARFITVAFRKA
jgi:ubiquinone/menaquinone biosynthesis C-methylase UbiE